MTSDQKAWAQWSIAHEQHELQQLEAGQWPEWATHTRRTDPLTLEARRTYADWCLHAVLKAIVPVLPKALRVPVQACCDLRTRIWSQEYLDTYYAAQQKASSACLPASNSL